MKQLLLIPLVVASLYGRSIAQQRARIEIESIQGPTPYTSLDLNNKAENFQFAIVTDRTGGHRPGVFEIGIEKLNLLQPEFVMSVGDLIEGYTEDITELDRQWDEFEGFVEKLKMPFFYVPGNHDITNKVMEKKWQERFGPTYYHFVYQDVLFLCLNSEDNARGARRGTVDDEQYAYIQKVLADHPDVRWTLIFMHQPLWNQEAETLRWNDVEALLNDRNHTVFVGHVHRYVKYERNNGKYFTLATTGGGSSLRGKALGEFDHVVWVTKTEKGPLLANLMLEGVWDEDVTTEEVIAFTRPLADGQPIRIEPLLVQNQADQYQTEIRLTNDSDVPMEVSLEMIANPELSPNFGAQRYTVAPNSVEKVPLTLRADKTTALGKLKPLRLKAHILYIPEKLPELSFKREFLLRPEIESPLFRKEGPVQVDGNLREWGKLSYDLSNTPYLKADPFSHQGKEDASLTFSTAYDDQYVYLAARVYDDELLTDINNRWSNEQDALILALDARAPSTSANGQGGYGENLYVAVIPQFDDQTETLLHRPAYLPEGTLGAAQKVEGGYTVEMAIPIKYIQETYGSEDWQYLRINVAQVDFDNDWQHESFLFWRPDWREDQNYVGSGMVKKNNKKLSASPSDK